MSLLSLSSPQLSFPPSRVMALKRSNSGPKLPKNLRYLRRAKLPPEAKTKRIPLKKTAFPDPTWDGNFESQQKDTNDESVGVEDENFDDSAWTEDEIAVISSLFERGPPKKPKSLPKLRSPPPPNYKNRPSGIPTTKQHIRSVSRSTLSPRSPLGARTCKDPSVLVAIAKEIGELPKNVDASEVLDRWSRFIRKGSLSMTIRELGHMGMPERALQTLCWVQKHRPTLFPDDRVLASAVEILARNRQLRIDGRIDEYLFSASRSVVEAMAKGFIKAGKLNMARRVLLFAKDHSRTLDSGIHAKLILEAGKNPDRYRLVEVLIDELGEREDFDLEPQDCTAVMKVCIRMGKFQAVESLFEWFKNSGRNPSVVMYTTVIHSRYCSRNFREGLAIVWEMEGLDVLLDLPAYRVVIRLCIALNDLDRAVRYFSRLKEVGFSPTYDIYRDMIKAYAASGRLAKCRQVCKELEMAGFKLDNGMASVIQHLGRSVRSIS